MKTKVFIFTPTELEISHDFENFEDYETDIHWVARGNLEIDHGRLISCTWRNGDHLYWNSQHALQSEQKTYILGVFRQYVNATIVQAMLDAKVKAVQDWDKAIAEATMYASSSVG